MRNFRCRATRAGHKNGQMNGTERAYSEILELRKRAGEVLEWAFEPEKFRLADRTYYTPDFRVIMADGTVEFHEVKGFMEDDAAIKIKVVAEIHPYVFKLVRLNKKGCQITTV